MNLYANSIGTIPCDPSGTFSKPTATLTIIAAAKALTPTPKGYNTTTSSRRTTAYIGGKTALIKLQKILHSENYAIR